MPAASPTINPGPVLSAGAVATIGDALGLQPSLRESVTGWFKPMTIGIITSKIIEEGPKVGQAKESVHEIETAGMIQPGDGEELEIKEEGEWSWKTCLLHVYRQLDVETDARLKIKGVPYRVMAKKDFVENGYIRYKLQEDYAGV